MCDLNPLRKEMIFGRVVVNQNGSHLFTAQLSKANDSRTVPVPQPFTNVIGDLIARSGFSRDVLKPAVARAGIVERRIHLMRERYEEGRARMAEYMRRADRLRG